MLIVLWPHRRASTTGLAGGSDSIGGAEKRRHRRQFPTRRYSIPKADFVRAVVSDAVPRITEAVARVKAQLEFNVSEPQTDAAKELLSTIEGKLESRKPFEENKREIQNLEQKLRSLDDEILLLNQIADLNDLLDGLYLDQLSNELADLEHGIFRELRFREDEELLLAFITLH